MESRKYQLQKQIIEALESKDNDLYALLKSQWAHRFGVESLEELKNLDLDQQIQNLNNLDNKKIEKPQDISSDAEKALHLKENGNQEKEIRVNELDSTNDKNDQAFRARPHQEVHEENNKIKKANSPIDNKSNIHIQALIPLPPKPKYSYLKKWLIKK